MFRTIYSFFHRHYHRRYHGVYAHAKQLFIFDIVLLGLAMLMLGTTLWLLFWKPGLTNQIELTLSIGEERVKSGEPVTLRLAYTNHSKFKLTEPTLAVRLPPGFVLDRTKTPESILSTQSIIPISEIPAGGSGAAELHGTLWTTPGHEEKIVALLSYTPEHNDRREQKIGSLLATLSESVLQGELLVASSSFPNQKIPVTFTITNTGNSAINQITLARRGASLQGDLDKNSTFTLGAGERKQITGELVTPTGPQSITLLVAPKIVINNHSLEQQASQSTINIISPSLSATAVFVNPPRFADARGTLPLTLQWKNDSPFPLRNQRIRLRFTPGIVDIVTTARENRLKADGKDLLIDATTRTALSTGTGSNSDSFAITLFLLPTFAADSGSNQLEIFPSAEAELASVPGQIFSTAGATLKLPLATQLLLTTEVRYYTEEGDQLGRGPLPPRLGETTKYWIFVQLKNTINMVEDVSFSTSLPAGVTFTGKQSVTIGPELSYNQTTRTLSWRFRELPKDSQTGLYFEVAVTPSPEQLGRTLTLTNNFTITARDSVVGKNFNLSNKGLINQLPANDRGSSRGAEVAAE